MSVIQMPAAVQSMSSVQDTFIRQTYYVTSELICAIDRIAAEEKVTKNDVLRSLLTDAINAKYPELLNEVEGEAAVLRRKNADKLRKNFDLDAKPKKPKKPHK